MPSSIESCMAGLAAAMADLRPYLRHTSECMERPFRVPGHIGCICGFPDAARRLDVALHALDGVMVDILERQRVQ